jgi:hypothetical protein
MFISAAISSLHTHLKSTSFGDHSFIGFRYDPVAMFGNQIREDVAKESWAMGKRLGKKWLGATWSRGTLAQQMKRITSIDHVIQIEGDDQVVASYKGRVCDCDISYVFYSPWPAFLEQLEEKITVLDFGAMVPSAEVPLVSGPYSFSVNVVKMDVGSFGHLDTYTDGIMSTLGVTAHLTFPVLVDSHLVKTAESFLLNIYHKTVMADSEVETLLSSKTIEKI